MSGRIINGIKYIYIHNDNEFKKKSFEDNVYFTLRDIFNNADSCDTIMKANYLNDLLTGNISFEERDNTFQYLNIYDKEYLSKLIIFLKHFTEYWFEFIEPENEEIQMKKYMKFDDWWIQFQELRKIIEYQKIVSENN